MKMQFNESDIYDVRIDELQLSGNDGESYCGFNADVDNVNYTDDMVTIDISGTCGFYSYHSEYMNCKFNGTLKMETWKFTGEYTSAAEDCRKYVEFDGTADISIDNDIDIDIKDDVIKDDINDTIDQLYYKFKNIIVEDNMQYGIFEHIIPYLTNTDKVINAIKKIDQKDIKNNDDLEQYLADNCFDICDEEYSELHDLLFAELKRLIKNGKINEIIQKIADDAADYVETHDIKARVYFSDLDP